MRAPPNCCATDRTMRAPSSTVPIFLPCHIRGGWCLCPCAAILGVTHTHGGLETTRVVTPGSGSSFGGKGAVASCSMMRGQPEGSAGADVGGQGGTNPSPHPSCGMHHPNMGGARRTVAFKAERAQVACGTVDELGAELRAIDARDAEGEGGGDCEHMCVWR
eukprot:7385060-Prymnesium_polylepis.1